MVQLTSLLALTLTLQRDSILDLVASLYNWRGRKPRADKIAADGMSNGAVKTAR